MARPTNKNANFVSVNVFRLRQIASSMSNEELGSWVRKALDDMSIGCIGENVDPVVKVAYDDALSAMVKEQERKRAAYEAKKNNAQSASSTALAPVNGSKRNDQLVWGRFENVFLSNDEYNTLLQDFGNINFLKETIEAFSASLADGQTQSNNHFATLTRWIAARKRWNEEREQGKETFAEREGRRHHELLKNFGMIK